MNSTRNEAMLQALGKHLKKIRENREMSLRKLADKAAVDFSQIHRIEKGESNPSFTMLLALAGALEVEPAFLFTFDRPDAGE